MGVPHPSSIFIDFYRWFFHEINHPDLAIYLNHPCLIDFSIIINHPNLAIGVPHLWNPPVFFGAQGRARLTDSGVTVMTPGGSTSHLAGRASSQVR